MALFLYKRLLIPRFDFYRLHLGLKQKLEYNLKKHIDLLIQRTLRDFFVSETAETPKVAWAPEAVHLCQISNYSCT